MFVKKLAIDEAANWQDKSLVLSDGVELVSRVWIPKRGGPWPALLMRQPYGKELASTITYAHPSWWASHGYLVVIQDVRGQGASGGEFKGFDQEASDTTQTHKWVRSFQECNGLLGTYGFSYQGLTQLLAERDTPPPDCLAPAMTGLNEKDHWSSDGNACWWHLGLAWGLQLASLKARRNGEWETWEKLRICLEEGTYLREGLLLLKQHDPDGMPLKWLLNSNENDQTKIYKPLNTWLRQPMLLIGGWWDPHLKGIIDLYKQSKAAGGLPDIHIGPATHLQWWNGSQELQLKFFNQHLKSSKKSSNQKPQKKLWNITTNSWENPINIYPGNESKNYFWGLKSNGLACLDLKDGLLQRNSKGKGLIHLVHDPWRPAPSTGGHLSPNPGKAERSSIDLRSDVATFTTPSLKESLRLEGIPTLKLTVKGDQQGFDLCVACSIINKAQTKVEQLSTGFLRIMGPEAMQATQRTIHFQPMLATLKKGERLRISIAGAAWPAIGVNPGHSEKPCGPSGFHCFVINISCDLTTSIFQVLPLLPD